MGENTNHKSYKRLTSRIYKQENEKTFLPGEHMTIQQVN